MTPIEDDIRRLTAFHGRGPGTDAERRAASWLAERVRAGGRATRTEPAWVRPHWPAVHLLHLALAVAGSVLAGREPEVGLGLTVAALLLLAGDLTGRAPLLRFLTPSRATQNVVAPPPADAEPKPVRLVVAASYDAGRTGFVYRDGIRRAAARLQRAGRGRLPGAWALLALDIALLAAIAGAHVRGNEPDWLTPVQLGLTVVLLLAAAVLLDVGLSRFGPAAGDNATGVAVALAVVEALDDAPPRNLEVELVLAGAGEGPALGMRAYVRRRRARWAREAVAVLNVAACTAGRPRFSVSDGPIVPLRAHPRLVELAREVARDEAHLGAAPHRSHHVSGAYPARAAGWPAITIGTRDEDGIVPRSHRPDDTPERVDPAAAERALEFCLALVERLDRDVGARAARGERAGRRGR